LFPEGEVTACNHDGEGDNPWHFSYHCGCCCRLLEDEPTHWMSLSRVQRLQRINYERRKRFNKSI
jgi:hypothetical protein